ANAAAPSKDRAAVMTGADAHTSGTAPGLRSIIDCRIVGHRSGSSTASGAPSVRSTSTGESSATPTNARSGRTECGAAVAREMRSEYEDMVNSIKHAPRPTGRALWAGI